MFRIAPTPSGFLHVGNACNALLVWRCAQRMGGRVLLRIDDLDADRKRPEYVEEIFRVLDWLGVGWDVGPDGPDDFERNWSQHRRLPLYQALLRQLTDRGLVYACALSRTGIRAMTEAGQYPAAGRQRGSRIGPAPDEVQLTLPWRIETPERWFAFSDWNGRQHEVALMAAMPDFVVRRRDGIPAYQVASVADDAYFGVSHVVRGSDLLPSTAAQLLLMELVGMAPPQYLHHPLLTDENGEKLSKSAGALALEARKTPQMRAFIENIVEGWEEELRL